jgi:HEAT repeat protein
MIPLPVLVDGAVALLVLWLALSSWIVLGRARHDRVNRLTARDAAWLADSRLTALGFARRRLWRVAEGVGGPAAVTAARELVRRESGKLLRRTARGGLGQTRALRVLARGGSRLAFDALRAARAGGRPEVIAAVVAITAELDTPQADELLLDVLVGGDYPRSRTATELAPRAQRLVVPLLRLARHPDPAVRYWTLMLLVNVAPQPAVLIAAVDAVSDPDAQVRGAAARLLGACNSSEAQFALRSLLTDGVFFVRAHAARAVGEIAAQPLAGEVAALLSDESWWVRAAARESLLALGDAGFAAAVGVLNDEDRFARDGAADVVFGFERLRSATGETSSQLLERLVG